MKVSITIVEDNSPNDFTFAGQKVVSDHCPLGCS
jgi:hypothetical protein